MDHSKQTVSDELQSAVDMFSGSLNSIVQKMKEEQDHEVQQRLDEELAVLAPHIRRDPGVSEFMPLGDPSSSLGIFAQNILTERWLPMVVETDAQGRVTDQSVREAADKIIRGMPLREYNLDGDVDNEQLIRAMYSSEEKWELDPHAVAMVNAIRNYVLGRGVNIGCTVSKVSREIETFWAESNMDARLKQAIPRQWVFGEHYFLYFVGADGRVRIHDRTKPYEITKIECHPEDAEQRLAYGRVKAANGRISTLSSDRESLEFFADINYFEQLQDGEFGVRAPSHNKLNENRLMQMVKFASSSVKRGTPNMYSVLRYLTYYEHFVLDRVVLNHERSKVVWVRKITGSRSIEGGRAAQAPKAGMMLTETDQLQYKPLNANINADDVKEDARLIRLTISAATGIPEHVIFQDASNQVYASIRSQDTPFAQNISSLQDDWTGAIKAMVRTVLRERTVRGPLPRTTNVELFSLEAQNKILDEIAPMIKEGVPQEETLRALEELATELPTTTVRIPTQNVNIDINFPNMVQERALDRARETEILARNKIASLHSLAAAHGFRWPEESRLMRAEKEMFPEEAPADNRLNRKTDTSPTDNPPATPDDDGDE